MRITVVRGDIVSQPVDAIVTAGNRSLRGGSGVNGAVHAAAGPRLLTASRALAPCPPGSAVVTPAFDLTPARWVIHAVGPKCTGRADAAMLAASYTASLARADEVGAHTVAFPSISTGVYGYPEERAAEVSVAALLAASTDVESVLLVAFRSRMASLWSAVLERSVPAEAQRRGTQAQIDRVDRVGPSQSAASPQGVRRRTATCQRRPTPLNNKFAGQRVDQTGSSRSSNRPNSPPGTTD